VFEGTGAGVENVVLIAMALVEADGDALFAGGEAGADKEREATAGGDSARWVEMVGDAGEFEDESISRAAEGELEGAATVRVVVGGVGDRLARGGGGVASSAAAIVTTFGGGRVSGCRARQRRQRWQRGWMMGSFSKKGDNLLRFRLLIILHLRAAPAVEMGIMLQRVASSCAAAAAHRQSGNETRARRWREGRDRTGQDRAK
jgi:hypothetical protein